jgi:hypothetical protein
MNDLNIELMLTLLYHRHNIHHLICVHYLQVTLPATALRAIEVRSSSDVYLAPGFASEALKLTTGQLGGSIAASQLAAKQLSISAAG